MVAGYVSYFVATSVHTAHCKHEYLESFAGTLRFVPGTHYHKVPEMSLATAPLCPYPCSDTRQTRHCHDTVNWVSSEQNHTWQTVRDCCVLDGHLKLTAYTPGCCSIPQTGHITYSSTPGQQPVNQSTKYHRQQPPV